MQFVITFPQGDPTGDFDESERATIITNMIKLICMLDPPQPNYD